MSVALSVVVLGLLVYAAISDVRTLRIPNSVSFVVVALYPLYVLTSPAAVPWPGALLLGGVTFLAGIGLFAARALGGGDVKLLAAAALWAGPDHFTLFLLTTALAGGVLAMAALLWRRFAPLLALWRPIAGLDVLAARPVLPYGVAIAAGGVAVALRLLGS